MVKESKKGTCVACGKEFEKLTFEHVPPKSTGNQNTAQLYQLKGQQNIYQKQQQKGAGYYSLCAEHNTLFGLEYVRCFEMVVSELANSINDITNEISSNVGISNVLSYAPFYGKDYRFKAEFNSLLFAKEVIAMFITLLGVSSASDSDICSISRRFVDLIRTSDFLLDPDKTEFPTDEYLILMNIYIPDEEESNSTTPLGRIELSGETFFYSEVRMSPLCFTLFYKNGSQLEAFRGFDMIEFLNSDNIQRTIDIQIPIFNGKLPKPVGKFEWLAPIPFYLKSI